MADKVEAKQFKAFEMELDGISRELMEDHYKLYQGYVNKTNEIREKLESVDLSTANQVYSDLRALKVDYTFALLGYKNHELYFGHLGGPGGEPNGRFAELIDENFGGFDGWQADARASCMAARGWVWVGYDLHDGSLFNYIGDTQNLWAVHSMVPALAIDVYEHAYARDYGATPDGRKQYLDAFFRNIDWDDVNQQVAAAEAAKIAAA